MIKLDKSSNEEILEFFKDNYDDIKETFKLVKNNRDLVEAATNGVMSGEYKIVSTYQEAEKLTKFLGYKTFYQTTTTNGGKLCFFCIKPYGDNQ